jgi:hypothetical protein
LIIVCLSYTHELHRDVDVPDGDLLIHAGDITFFSRRPSVLADFNEWLGEQPHRYEVVIPGNHDLLLEDEAKRNAIANAHPDSSLIKTANKLPPDNWGQLVDIQR